MYKQVQYSMANTLRRMCICYSDSAAAVSDNVADVLSDDTEVYDVDEMDDVDEVYDDVEPSSSATELYSCSSDDDDVDQPPTTRQRLDNQVRPVCYGRPRELGRPYYILALWFLLSLFFFLSSPNLSGRRFDVYHTSTYSTCTITSCARVRTTVTSDCGISATRAL